MAPSWLRGIFPPIPTAFGQDGALGPALPPFFEHLGVAGIDGVVALGSNGEAIMLSDRERAEWTAAVRHALPAGMHLIAGTGAESTLRTLELTRLAASVGAEAALVITPSFYRRDIDESHYHDHFLTVAAASPIPILVYNVPQLTGVDLPASWFTRLPAHANLVGVKDSSGNLRKLAEVRAARPDLLLLPGVGSQLAEAIEAGADGGIPALANVAPEACVGVRRAFNAGDAELAHRLQEQISALGDWLAGPHGIARLKAALRLQGFDHGDPRPPLPPLRDDAQVGAVLDRAGLLEHPVQRAS